MEFVGSDSLELYCHILKLSLTMNPKFENYNIYHHVFHGMYILPKVVFLVFFSSSSASFFISQAFTTLTRQLIADIHRGYSSLLTTPTFPPARTKDRSSSKRRIKRLYKKSRSAVSENEKVESAGNSERHRRECDLKGPAKG